jgi:hypothetical protein
LFQFPDYVLHISGTTLGSYIKALIVTGEKGSKYYNYTVPSLSKNANAAGIRAGVCNVLASVMPLEHLIEITGDPSPQTS